MRLILTLLAVALLATPTSQASACREILGVRVDDDCPEDASPPSTAAISRSAERSLLEAVNGARTAHGLRPLQPEPAADTLAREHARWMSDRARVRHNLRLEDRDVRSRLGSPSRVAENVGKGPRADSVHVAFMKSPGHRGNILGPFDTIGIGVVFDGHTYWTTEVFISGHPATGTARRSLRPFDPAALLALPGGSAGVQPEAARPSATPVGGANAAPWLGGAAVALGLGIVRGARSRSPGRAQ